MKAEWYMLTEMSENTTERVEENSRAGWKDWTKERKKSSFLREREVHLHCHQYNGRIVRVWNQ